MLFYFIMFVGIGFAIAKFVADKKVSLGLIAGLAFLWGLSHRGFWGFVTLGELLLGFVMFDIFFKQKNSDSVREEDPL